ncbi:MAG: DUF1150 family protein [Alphaproteobacteria bacterium]
MTSNQFTDPGGQPIVYIREVTPEEFPDELRGTTHKLYGVHDANGNRLALAPDRRVAFALARRNDMVALSVH